MIFSIILASVFVFGALLCYASCCAAARTDRQTEEYFAFKEQENKVAGKYTPNDIRKLYGLEPISENLKDSELIEIKCVGCGRPRLVPPKTIIAYLCTDCCKELKRKIDSENLKD